MLLGSLPGDISLQKQQYYAHPQNRFWKVISALFEREPTNDYAERKNLLLTNRIAVWDVCAQAVREGSMDTNILNEIPNDIHALIMANPSIKTIAFNGQKAQKLYHKYFEPVGGLNYCTLPSTSPANAQFTLERLKEHWRDALIK